MKYSIKVNEVRAKEGSNIKGFATVVFGDSFKITNIAMDRMHITKKLSVPISVMFRFFPTIKEEYRNVQDAMKLRGVGSVRDPMKMLEYRMVLLL